MKKQALALLTMFMAMLASGSAFAQANTFRAEVPFAFVVGNQELPAGSYQFERLLGKPSSQDSIGMLAVRNPERHIYKVVITSLSDAESEKPAAAKLRFRRHDGQSYLEQVSIAGDARSQVLRAASREMQVAGGQASSAEIAMTRMR